MKRRAFHFSNHRGQELAAQLEVPDGATRAYALFAHCFACSKDVTAASRISSALVERGIAVLRFDFTGLGKSEGDFANESFSSNLEDLVAAADHLREIERAPSLLVGHGLGGAAVLAAAHRIEEAKAVVTIGAPADPSDVLKLLKVPLDQIEAGDSREIVLTGQSFRVDRHFLEDLSDHNMADRIRHLRKALLIFHSPTDQIVGIDQAAKIYQQAIHPKSFISLDGADHMLTRPEDSDYVAHTMAAWASRYLQAPAIERPKREDGGHGAVVDVETTDGRYTQRIQTGPHVFLSDEPVDVGGDDKGPNPYDLLLAALGSCTSMTMRMYAERKGWPLESVSVHLEHNKIHAKDCTDCEQETGMIDQVKRQISVGGPLDEAQRARLLEIADRCPVHRTLSSATKIRTQAVD